MKWLFEVHAQDEFFEAYSVPVAVSKGGDIDCKAVAEFTALRHGIDLIRRHVKARITGSSVEFVDYET